MQPAWRPEVAVYFVQADTGEIKIGYSAAPWSRLVKMQADNPRQLCMIGLIEGDRGCERELHRRFSADHLRGDWFLATPDLLAFCRAHPLAEGARSQIEPRRDRPYDVIDHLAAELGVHEETRKKWRQRGRVSGQMRTPILAVAKERQIEIDLAAFDAFGSKRPSRAASAKQSGMTNLLPLSTDFRDNKQFCQEPNK